MHWYIEVLKKYAVFSGRSRRKEYWMFSLILSITLIIISVLDTVIFGAAFEDTGPLNILYSLGMLVPSLAVSVRRLHDVDKSGWFLLIGLIPLIGLVWLLILACRDSDAGENQYGVNPKGITGSDTIKKDNFYD